jgi:thioesterase domain-containing protein
MEDIAAYYVSEILKQNPDGPYALAGYSLGGIIGFEMAKQLKAMGKEIKMLAMFDTYADNSNYFNPFLLNITKKFRRQLPKMLFILRSFFRQPWQTFLYQAEFVNGKFRKLFGMKPKNEDEGPSYDDKLAAKYEYAYVNYKMTPYDGEIDLFKVKTRLYYLDDMIYLGWNQFAQKGVNVYEITGDHKTFLYPPHDKEFARILQQALDERTSIKEIGKNSSQGKSKLKAV